MRSKLGTLPFVILLLPFDLIVALGISFACLCSFLEIGARRVKNPGQTRFSAPQENLGLTRIFHPSGPDFQKAATIIIVNWDGKHLLAECLPAVIEAVRCDGRPHEILVVDNGSTDGSAEYIRQNFPQVRVLPLDRNYGFADGNNRGVAKVHTEIVVLLNNDMIVDSGFLAPLLAGFSDPAVFAVTSQIFFADASRRRAETGKTRARFDRGFFYFWHDEIDSDDESRETVPVFWAGGGSSAIDRNKYLAMGGLDLLYHPFYVEDTDLSYQAWKRGWKCLLAPQSRVVHKHRSTSKVKFGDRFVDNTTRKNQYLFIWKNVTDSSMILEHVLNLPRIHGHAMLHDVEIGFEIRAFLRALRQLPESLKERLANLPQYAISDRDAIARTRQS